MNVDRKTGGGWGEIFIFIVYWVMELKQEGTRESRSFLTICDVNFHTNAFEDRPHLY
jgi:hypothetical protein